MKYSVVMPAFNAAGHIEAALASALGQTWPPHEVVVVNDGSSDGTAEVLRRCAEQHPTLLVITNPKNVGIGESLRRAVSCASGDWILRLDADDRWHAGHAAAIKDALAFTPNAVLAASGACFVSDSQAPLGAMQPPRASEVRRKLMWDNPLVHSAVGFRRADYERVGGYALDARWEDYDLWIKLLSVGELASVQQHTVDYTVSSKSLSRVGKRLSLQGRWQCQQAAIKIFWRTAPTSAAVAALVGGARNLFLR